jgi:predicted N-acetyltransferase YhbS
MITIDFLKNHPESIIQLVHIGHEVLGKIWTPDIQIEDVITRFQTHMNDDKLPISLVAFDGSLPIGMCSLRKNEGNKAELSPLFGSLVVDPSYQKQGIGNMLINETKEKAKSLGFNKAYLFALDAAISLYYEKRGWRKIGTNEFRSYHVTVMEISL